MPAHRSPRWRCCPQPGACSSCNARPTARAHRLCRACSPISAPTACWCCTRLRACWAPLLTHTSTIPLAVMEGGSAGVLSCYKSLKHIATHTGLPCTVASVLQTDTPAERRKVLGALQTLQDCAERHLGGRVRTTTVSANNPTTFNAWPCNCWKTRAPSTGRWAPCPRAV